MKHAILITMLLATLIPAGLFAADESFGALGAKGKDDLNLEQMLTYAIQDEYLARSEYKAIIERYGTIRPFSNIIRAEERHIQWLRELYAGRGLAFPVDESAARVVVPADLVSALETGVQAEMENIAMYDEFLNADAATPLPADVRETFERLKSASENHLRAFRTNLSRYE